MPKQTSKTLFVCPHSVIRSKVFHHDHLEDAPDGFRSAPIDIRGFPETRYALQISVEDCPARSKEKTGKKAINIGPKAPIAERELMRWRSVPTWS